MSTFFIVCGGSGGHLAPGIAIGEKLKAQGHHCKLIISKKEVDSRLIQKYSHLAFIKAPGVPFSLKPFRLIQFFYLQLYAFFFHLKMLRTFKPDLIIGFGDYLTIGAVFAGFFVGVPSVLHEANRHTGKAIRLMSGLALRVYLPEGVHLKSFPPQAIRHYGYPVRDEITAMPKKSTRARLGFPDYGRLLLVSGGSQGALSLNEWVDQNAQALAQEGIHVYCICGLGKHKDDRLTYTGAHGLEYYIQFVSFVDNMSAPVSACDLALSRAGAGTIAEFIRCRVPAILVPYPYASNNHQLKNANYHEVQGACVVIEADNVKNLFKEVIDLIYNDSLLESFRNNLNRLDHSDNLALITKDLEKLAKESKAQKR